MSGLIISGFEKKNKIIQNLVTMEKCLKVDENFLQLFFQRKIFSQGMLNDIMRNESPSFDYCMKLLRCGLYAFTQFVDITIETK